MMTEECKKEIINYLIKEEWLNKDNEHFITPSFINGSMYIHIFLLKTSIKGINRKILIRIKQNQETYERYFLEYIGFILKKHNMKEVSIYTTTYTSTSWKFKEIKRIP